MLNLIKKIFNRNRKVTPTISSQRLINGVIEFIQHRKENLNPRFTYFDETGKKKPLYTFDSHFPKGSSTQEKLLILSRLLRLIHITSGLQNSMTFAYGVKDDTSRIKARYTEEYEDSNCVIVDFQTPDGPAYVVVDYSIDGDEGQIGDREMYAGSERVFFEPGQVFSRRLDDLFVFFKVLKVTTEGLHILCYGNEVLGTQISEIVEVDDFHFNCNESFQDFIIDLAERVESSDESLDLDDDVYDIIYEKLHFPGSHLPISWDIIDEWDIARHAFIPVFSNELSGYYRWESDGGVYF